MTERDGSGATPANVVLGVIGNDPHVIGNRIIDHALTDRGFHVVNLGVMVPPEDFIEAAIESNAEAILISSLSGMGEVFCRDIRERCVEAGLDDIILYVGGNIAMGRLPWDQVEAMFLDMGFDRVYAPHTRPEVFLTNLEQDIQERRDSRQGADSQ